MIKIIKEYHKGERIDFHYNYRGNGHASYWAYDLQKNYMGYIDFSEYNSPYNKEYDCLIEMVEVVKEYKGLGIGKALIRRLAQDFPYTRINWGWVTEDGHVLKKAMDKEFEFYIKRGYDMWGKSLKK
jgi:GNAT superfamily N-acetyltransferase